MHAAAATPALTIERLREIVARVANRGFAATVTPHRVGFAIEVPGKYAAEDLAWMSKQLRECFDLAARKCGGYVIVTAVR